MNLSPSTSQADSRRFVEMIVFKPGTDVAIDRNGNMIKLRQYDDYDVGFFLNKDDHTMSEDRYMKTCILQEEFQKAVIAIKNKLKTKRVHYRKSQIEEDIPFSKMTLIMVLGMAGLSQGQENNNTGMNDRGTMLNNEKVKFTTITNGSPSVISKYKQAVLSVSRRSGADVMMAEEASPDPHEKVFMFHGTKQQIRRAIRVITACLKDGPGENAKPIFRFRVLEEATKVVMEMNASLYVEKHFYFKILELEPGEDVSLRIRVVRDEPIRLEIVKRKRRDDDDQDLRKVKQQKMDEDSKKVKQEKMNENLKMVKQEKMDVGLKKVKQEKMDVGLKKVKQEKMDVDLKEVRQEKMDVKKVKQKKMDEDSKNVKQEKIIMDLLQKVKQDMDLKKLKREKIQYVV